MKKVILLFLIIILVIAIIVLVINFFVRLSTNKQIISEEEASKLENVDCIIILGAGIWGNSPSPMLEDRLNQGISLYKKGASNKIIMSGDHGKEDYDEVNVMKQFAIDKGVPSEDIFMDHAGFSSYESIYRAKEIFKASKVIIVTQQYHLYRSIYIANSFELDAYGVASNPRQYSGQAFRELREIVARNKDVFKCIIKPQPTYLGETIPVSGNGDTTNDKNEI